MWKVTILGAAALLLFGGQPSPCSAAETSAGEPSAAPAEPLRVFATTTDLGDMARQVGGDRVTVVDMVKGREDPHFAEAKPSFIKELSRADVFLEVGLSMEVGYVPLLLSNARNPRVLPGAPGFVDASRAITPLDVVAGRVDRSMGDVHAGGSPHYMLDPLRVFEVARMVAARFSEIRPADKAYFEARLTDFRSRLATALVGATLAAKYDAFKLAALAEKGGLATFLDQQGDRTALGGWLGAVLPFAGTKAVDDHPMWAYFAKRFGLVIVGHLEPKPGIPPTPTHLREVIDLMKADDVHLVISSPYYDPRHARLIAGVTQSQVVELSHQTGGRDGTADYLAMIDYNVRTLVAALEKLK